MMLALPVRIPFSESAEISTSPMQERMSPTPFSNYRFTSLYNFFQLSSNSQPQELDALPEIRSPSLHFPLIVKKIFSASPYSSPSTPNSPLLGSSKMVMIPSSSSALLFRRCPKQQPRGYTMSPFPLLRGLMMSLLFSTIFGISSLDFSSISWNQTVQFISLICLFFLLNTRLLTSTSSSIANTIFVYLIPRRMT